jgi:hypothetical protein
MPRHCSTTYNVPGRAARLHPFPTGSVENGFPRTIDRLSEQRQLHLNNQVEGLPLRDGRPAWRTDAMPSTAYRSWQRVVKVRADRVVVLLPAPWPKRR